MKVEKACYLDDGISVQGVLVKRLFRKPVFISADPRCGWNKQIIEKSEEGKVVVLCSRAHQGTVRCYPKVQNSSAEAPHASHIKALTVEELKSMPILEWVWIEELQKQTSNEKASAYYRKHEDYTKDKAFVCGYPGISYSFYYEDYGKTWLAYPHAPSNAAL